MAPPCAMPPGPKFKKGGALLHLPKKGPKNFWGHKPKNFENFENGLGPKKFWGYKRCLCRRGDGKGLVKVYSQLIDIRPNIY
jgi:hypothetical protein